MAFLRTFTVRHLGASKIIWVPKSWRMSRGQWVHYQANLKGRMWHMTDQVKGGSTSFYITIPASWPCEIGDIIDLSVAYATVEIPDTPKERKPMHEGNRKFLENNASKRKAREKAQRENTDADTGTDHQEGDQEVC